MGKRKKLVKLNFTIIFAWIKFFFYRSRGGRKKKNEESQVLWHDKDEETERSRLSRELETPKLFWKQIQFFFGNWRFDIKLFFK